MVEDGLNETFEIPDLHRVTLTSAGNRFYYSAFSGSGPGRKLEFSYFDLTGTKSTKVGEVSAMIVEAAGGASVPSLPASAAGMVAEEGVVPRIHAYIAAGASSVKTDSSTVWHLVFDQDLSLLTGAGRSARAATDASYAPASERNYPVVWLAPSTSVHGAWIGATGVFLHHAGGVPFSSGAQPTFAGNVKVIAPIGAGQSVGLVMGTSGLQAQLESQASSSQVSTCGSGGEVTNLTTAFTGIPGIWWATWTRLSASQVSTESSLIACQAGPPAVCSYQKADCQTDPPTVNVRNQVLDITRRTTDPAGRIFEFIATPSIQPGDAGQPPNGLLQLTVLQADIKLGAAGESTTKVLTPEPKTVARMPLVGAAGPDWPAMSSLGAEHLGMAWIEPTTAGGTRLRTVRYRLCLAP